jgi:hypothetical protein
LPAPLRPDLGRHPPSRACCTALTFPGRHSLIIYLVHQPILFGLFQRLGSGCGTLIRPDPASPFAFAFAKPGTRTFGARPMKFTLSWLKDHLDTDASVDAIAEALTDLGP